MRPRLLGSLLFGLLAVCFLAGQARSENARPAAPAGGAGQHHGERHADSGHSSAAEAAHAAKVAEHREHHEHHLSEEARHKLMSKFDANGDGKLDAAELANAKKMIGDYRQQREQALAAGKEFAKVEMLEQLLQQLESQAAGSGSNGTGTSGGSPNSGSSTGSPTTGANTPQLTAAERQALHQLREERHALHELRTDEALHELHRAEERHEGQLERHHALLKQFDTNHDGKLDAGERQAAKAAIQAHHQARAAEHHAKAGDTANHHASHSHHGK